MGIHITPDLCPCVAPLSSSTLDLDEASIVDADGSSAVTAAGERWPVLLKQALVAYT